MDLRAGRAPGVQDAPTELLTPQLDCGANVEVLELLTPANHMILP
jgi:hypothetical protein